MWNRVYTRASTLARAPQYAGLPPGMSDEDLPEDFA